MYFLNATRLNDTDAPVERENFFSEYNQFHGHYNGPFRVHLRPILLFG